MGILDEYGRNGSNRSVGDQPGRAIVFPFARGRDAGGWVLVNKLAFECDSIWCLFQGPPQSPS